MVDLNEKPQCEVICPFESCRYVTKLSLIKHFDLHAPLKFNTFNFERHINTQHVVKKRKAGGENKTPVKEKGRISNDETQLDSMDCDISQHKASFNGFRAHATSFQRHFIRQSLRNHRKF